MVPRNQHIKSRKPVAKPLAADLVATRERMSRASAQFLKVDLETALTFVKIAQETNDQSRRKRNIRSARKAYETVVKLSQKIEIPPEDTVTINEALQILRSELKSMGEVF
jgi:hypothetical protein